MAHAARPLRHATATAANATSRIAQPAESARCVVRDMLILPIETNRFRRPLARSTIVCLLSLRCKGPVSTSSTIESGRPGMSPRAEPRQGAVRSPLLASLPCKPTMRTLPRPASAQPGDPPSIGLRRGLIRRPRAGPNLQVRDPFCRRGQLLRRLASRQCFREVLPLVLSASSFSRRVRRCALSSRTQKSSPSQRRRRWQSSPRPNRARTRRTLLRPRRTGGKERTRQSPQRAANLANLRAESTPIRRQSAPIANRSAWSGVNDLLYSFRLLPKSKMRETPSRKHGRPHKKRLSVLIPHPESTDGSQIVAPHHPTLLSASGKGLQFL